LQRGPARAVGRGGHEKARGRVGHVAIHRRHRVIAEKRGERVEILRADRVELVVVARGAARGEAQPDSGHRLDAVLRVDRLVFGRDRAALAGRGEAAVVTGGDFLVERRLGQEIARHLLDGELIERQIPPKRPDYPVAVRPDRAVVVDVDAMCIRITDRIQPLAAELLGAGIGRQQAVDRAVVGGGRWVARKRRELLRRGRESGEIERDPAEQARGRLLAARRQTRTSPPLRDEMIDGSARPFLRDRGLGRNGRAHGRDQ
jgi:hypothetical protein